MSHSVLLGLIGANIQKSLAPALHEAALQQAGLRGHYHLMDLETLPGRDLPQLLAAARTAGFAGLNITSPCKEAVIALLDEVSDEARQVGAVNTVIFAADGRSTGFNTDRLGFRRSLEEAAGPAAVAGKSVALVGAGGAGRAVAFALLDLGAAALHIHDVDGRRAGALIGDIEARLGSGRAMLADSAAQAVRASDAVVNATPIGMQGIPGNPVPSDALGAHGFAADVIYTPLETEFIQAARARGIPAVTGDGMCVHQAVAAFELFTRRQTDPAFMRHRFATALAERDANRPAGP